VLRWFGRKKVAEGLVGLSVNDNRIAIAHISRRRDDIFLEHCEKLDLEDGTRPHEQLLKVVNRMGLAGAACSFVLAPREYNIYLVEAPQVEPDEVRQAIRWKIKDLLDMPVDEAVIDVFGLPKDTFRGRPDMVYAVAAARPKVDAVIDLVGRAGLELESIVIPEMAMRNISLHFADDHNGLAFLSLKQSGSTLNITRGGVLYLTRKINTPVGASALTDVDWEITRDRLALEIQRSLDYFESQMGQSPINQILIAPRKDDTESLMNSLGEALPMPVGKLDFTEELESSDAITAEVKGACMMAIGAALSSDTGVVAKT